MVMLGVGAHKRSGTIVSVDECGRKLGKTTIKTMADQLDLLSWAPRSC